jgi:hypothetical protein
MVSGELPGQMAGVTEATELSEEAIRRLGARWLGPAPLAAPTAV